MTVPYTEETVSDEDATSKVEGITEIDLKDAVQIKVQIYR